MLFAHVRKLEGGRVFTRWSIGCAHKPWITAFGFMLISGCIKAYVKPMTGHLEIEIDRLARSACCRPRKHLYGVGVGEGGRLGEQRSLLAD